MANGLPAGQAHNITTPATGGVEKSFLTSDGREIRFRTGYLDFAKRTAGLPKAASPDHELASMNVRGGPANLDYKAVAERFAEATPSISVRGYSFRLSRAYEFISMMDETMERFPFGKYLDIGCGFAYQPRILRGLGLVEEAVGVDIYDRCTSIDEKRLMRLHRRLRWWRMLEGVQRRIERIEPSRRSDIQRAILHKVSNPRELSKTGRGWKPDERYYNLKMVRRPHLDRFILGDIFELTEKFDLISSFTSLEWFEAPVILKKISELLNTGGVFYMFVGNWWATANATRLEGHFPYAAQRLEKGDYFRYLDECLPENAEPMKTTYQFFDPSHPVLSDYLEIGYKHGLVPLNFKSNVLPEMADRRRGMHPLGIALNDHGELMRILDDVRRFRPDVRLADLLASSHCIVFKKIDTAAELDEAALQGLYDDAAFQYRPTGAFMQLARKTAVRLLLNK